MQCVDLIHPLNIKIYKSIVCSAFFLVGTTCRVHDPSSKQFYSHFEDDDAASHSDRSESGLGRFCDKHSYSVFFLSASNWYLHGFVAS